MAQKNRTTLKTYFNTGDFPNESNFIDFIDSVLNFVDDGTPTTGDIKTKVSATDTTSNYLASKLVAGTNITLTINNPAGDETITIDGVAGSSEWSIASNKLSNDTQTVDYISLFADSVEIVRIGDGANPRIVVDPSATQGNTTGYWFSAGKTGFYEVSNNVIAVSGNNAYNFNLQAAGIRAVSTNRPEINFSSNPSSTNPVIRPRRISSTTGVGSSGANELSLIALATEIIRCTSTGVFVQVMKSGATQVAAGADANELWKTASHATLPDNVVMIGV